MNERSRSWEQMGAASGLFAVLLFVAAFLIFLNTDPSGGNTPRLPNIDNAEAAPAFFASHLNGIRAQVMLNGIGLDRLPAGSSEPSGASCAPRRAGRREARRSPPLVPWSESR